MNGLRALAMVLLAAVLGAGAGVGGYLLYQHSQESSDRPRRVAFELPDLQDQPQNASQWDGKIVVLNFWGSWCPPCLREVPYFVRLQQEYGDQGVQVVGVAIDRREDAADFAQRLGMNYPVLYGPPMAMELTRDYGHDGQTLPFTAIIDRDGVIHRAFGREVSYEELEEALLPLLAPSG